MRIRWLTYHNGHGGPHYPGDVSEVPEDLARKLIASGAAEAVHEATDKKE